MNAISEMKWNDKQGRSNASEGETKNKKTTSTLGIKNLIISTEYRNVLVVAPKE